MRSSSTGQLPFALGAESKLIEGRQLIQEHLKEMFGIIYAIQNYSRRFCKPEGCFLNIFDKDRIDDNLAQFGDADDIDYIVVPDGKEAIASSLSILSYLTRVWIWGIGDQGVGGILISATKLVLTTLCAGIHPPRILPVIKYDALVDEFFKSVSMLFPKEYLYLKHNLKEAPHTVSSRTDTGEDFGLTNAHRILYLYHPGVACGNDDVRGTGCVTLTAIMVGLHVSKLKLTDMRMHNLALKDSDKRLLPDVVDVREIGVKIAVAVIKQAVGERLSRLQDIPTSDEDLEELVRVQTMNPVYRPLVKLTGEKTTKLARGEAGLGGAG